MSSAPSENAPPLRFAGLDGLRAITVALVVLYHLLPQLIATSGYIGVDVFFVISGFLITSLLLRERNATGRIALWSFWKRRARRLLPALAVVVAVCTTAAWCIGGDVLVGIGRQVLGTATFSYNWFAIAAGSDYFQASLPELFRNLWSLAVEEQFYLVWPLALLALLWVTKRRWVRASIAGVLAVASAIGMSIVVGTASGGEAAVGASATRAYFGTDTHAFGLLLGVALAFVVEAVLARSEQWPGLAEVRRARRQWPPSPWSLCWPPCPRIRRCPPSRSSSWQ